MILVIRAPQSCRGITTLAPAAALAAAGAMFAVSEVQAQAPSLPPGPRRPSRGRPAVAASTGAASSLPAAGRGLPDHRLLTRG